MTDFDTKEDMNISPTTINLCLELLSQVSVPVTLPDAETKMVALVAARRELLAYAENGTDDLRPRSFANPPGDLVGVDSGDGVAEPHQNGMAAPHVDSIPH